MLEYRESSHTYYLDGRQIPGITRILADLNCYPGSGFYTENSRVRGQQAHLACQLTDRYCPQAKTLEEALEHLDAAPEIQPYLSNYVKFRREQRYLATAWEEPLCSVKLRVAGTPDTYGRMTFADGPWSVVDAKSWDSQGADPKHSAEVQTAGYAIMLGEKLGIPAHTIGRYVLKLPSKGNYRLYRCEDEHDFEECQWAVQLWHRWQQKGIFKFTGDPEPQPFAIGENA